MSEQEDATLILTDFRSRSARTEEEFDRRQKLDQALLGLLVNRTYYSRYCAEEKPFAPRIVVSSTQEPSNTMINADIALVKVPALESRKEDMRTIAIAKIGHFEEEYGLRNVQVGREVIHRLLDHSWEEGEPELDQEIRKALARLAEEKRENALASNLLRSDHMFDGIDEETVRHRLLYEFPVLRDIVKSPWIWDHTLRYIVTPAFLVVLGILFLGPQTRDHNTALTIFWAGWWPAVMLSFPFLGRIWCSVCPFMAIGNMAQEATQHLGIELKKWPKWVDSYGPPFAFGLFFLILMWEELWNLPQNGSLSAWLLLLITSGAVFNSVQYEKRMWCRHLCPIGAMCRTFATMSMVEVRSFKSNCQGCTDPKCLKGNSLGAEPSDTFAIKGCTMNLKNNQLRDMGFVSHSLL
mmetsp:Transcript_21056/g.37048  ORF Transcript_21056/g.37048 Transcript_21056/m.37048 type:complete len:409 (-) Transcript_21056:1554-2780(-)